MTKNLCGSCSFKKEKTLVERKEIFADVIELLTVSPGITLLCPNCDNQFIIVNGVLTTRLPAEIKADEKLLPDYYDLNKYKNGGFDLEEDISLQMDFFEIIRSENNSV